MRRIAIAFNKNAPERYGFAIDGGQGNIRHFGYFQYRDETDDNSRYKLVCQTISKKDKMIEIEEHILPIGNHVDISEKYYILEQFLEMISLIYSNKSIIHQLLIHGQDFSEMGGQEKTKVREMIEGIDNDSNSIFWEITITDVPTCGVFFTAMPECLPFDIPAKDNLKEVTAYAIELAVKQRKREEDYHQTLYAEDLIEAVLEALDVH